MSAGREQEAELVYLQHLEEARRWMEVVLATSLPPVAEFESRLNSGVLLCRLGEHFCPDEAMWRRVYDRNEEKFKMRGVDYRHTDNINFFLAFLKKVGLPKIFYPSTLDVYERKNLPRLVYCLHCLSHLLERKGVVPQAVEKVQGDTFSEHDVKQVSQTIKRGVMPKDLKSIRVAKQLVHEELQYVEMGMEGEDEEVAEETNNGDDDGDIYDTFQGIQAPESNAVVAMDTTDKLMAYLSCGISGVTVKVYSRSMTPAPKQSPVERILSVLSLAVTKSETEAVSKLLCSPPLGLDKVYTSPDMAQRYTSALAAVKTATMPRSVTCVYTGLMRERCDEVLEKALPGGYMLRESVTQPGQLVVSFRNKTGIKHWKIRTQDGRYTWGQSPAFPSIEAFTQNFCPSLSKATGLSVFPATGKELAVTGWEDVGKLVELSIAENAFTLKQVLEVVGEVNKEAQLRHHDALLQEQQEHLMQQQRQQEGVELELARQHALHTAHESVQLALLQRLEEQTQRIKELEERLAVTQGEGQGGGAVHSQNRKEGGQKEGAGQSPRPRPAPRRNQPPAPIQQDVITAKGQQSPLQVKKPTVEGQQSPLQVKKQTVEGQQSPLQVKKQTVEGGANKHNNSQINHAVEWEESMIYHVGRVGAERVLNQYGRPGSFLVRPSERCESDYAIVFKTETELRNWKVSMTDGKYTVKPYPQLFASLNDVVALFVQAVGEANHLTLIPLQLSKAAMDELFGYGTVKKNSSTDPEVPPRLVVPTSNNHTSSSPTPPTSQGGMSSDPRDWSSLQVSKWMSNRGLEQFVDTFLDHSVDGSCLLALDHDQLRDDLGVSALGHRHRILRCIREMREGGKQT